MRCSEKISNKHNQSNWRDNNGRIAVKLLSSQLILWPSIKKRQ